MVFEGKVVAPRQGDRYWQVSVASLGLYSQGKSETDAYAMVADALETVIDRRHFKARVIPVGGGRFLIGGNDSRVLMARWLYRVRMDSGLTLRAAAARVGSKTSEAWARYESGRASPTLQKLESLLEALDPGAGFVIKRATTRSAASSKRQTSSAPRRDVGRAPPDSAPTRRFKSQRPPRPVR
jgi:transcriptional regulator with XRE-family HTH domain